MTKYATCTNCLGVFDENHLTSNYCLGIEFRDCPKCNEAYRDEIKANYLNSFANKKRIELPDDEIVEQYQNGATLTELGKKYGVTAATISSRVKHLRKKYIIDLDEAKKMRDAGLNIKEIAKSLNLAYSIVYRKIRYI